MKAKIIGSVLFSFLLPLLSTNAWGWNPFGNSSKTGTIESAQQQFISEVQYMTEREALANEISYYKKPQITVKRALRNGQVSVIRTWKFYSEKEYAVDHPNDIVGAEYYFEGIFTHYNHGYERRKAKVLCINGKWFVIQRY